MPVPRVAIVGRPNVGKSSLTNLLAGERVAIVDPTPGVTRDRLSVLVTLEHPTDEGPERTIEITDTGGFGVYTAEGARYDEIGADLATLTEDIEQQIAEAVSTADLILFAVDAQAGPTSQDHAIATMLREQKLGDRTRHDGSSVPIRVVATKTDGESWEPHAFELAALGFGEPLMVSAKTKFRRRVLLEELYRIVPESTDPTPEPDVEMKLAIVGKRNAGKSTLVNRLAGEERVIVSEIAGTTRDAVDVRFELDGRSFLAIDTAGQRRKKSFQGQVEWYAFDRAKRAIDRCDACVLLIDATAEVSQVDEQLAQLVVESHKPVVIAVNKWDLAEGAAGPKGKPVGPADFEKYIRKELKGLDFAPIAFLSAKNGLNVRELVHLSFELFEQASTRVSTGELNRTIRAIIEQRTPSDARGTPAKLYFVSQVKTNPPTLVLIVNDPDIFDHNYERFLMNRLRERLPYEEVPIRIILRSRQRAELAAMKRKGGSKADRAEAQMHRTDPTTGQIDDATPDLTERFEELLADLPDDPEAFFDD